MPTLKHVTNADGKGWLQVRWQVGGTFPPLPQYLVVEFDRTEGGRDYFRALEGQNTGTNASVARRPDGNSYLADGDPRTGMARVIYDRTAGTLRFGSARPIAATTLASNPPPLGTHDLELPYEAHPGGAAYEGQSRFAKTWFRIGHSGDRFLHPGRVSAGCVTVTEIDRWTDLYEYLITARKGDGRSVGTINIIA